MTSRLYNFKSVLNFRDFGNYDTHHKRPVKSGHLFRSAHLNNVTAEEKRKIEALNIGLVVDLRHKPERVRQPNQWPESQTPHLLEYPDQPESADNALAPHEMFIQKDLLKPDDARHYMQSSYATRPDDAGFRQIFSDTLKFMAREGDPILIHCAAGKDRTGTLAAIIHGALGVDMNTIMQDYMLTMEAVDIDSFLEPAAQMMSEKFGRSYEAEALRPMFGVEPSYLENALTTMGDMDTYIADALSITSQERDAIFENYLNS